MSELTAVAVAGNKRYRPTLTATQIEHIVRLATNENPLSFTSISIIGALSPFLEKITGTYLGNTPFLAGSLVESLGGNPADAISKEQRWELAYKKSCTNSGNCTPQELEDALEHKYLHDLMTEEETTEFERIAFSKLEAIRSKEGT